MSAKITIIIEVTEGGEGCLARARVLTGGVEGEVLSEAQATMPSLSAVTQALSNTNLSAIWREIEKASR